MSLHNRTGLYLFFGSRWALLLSGLILYSKAGGVTPGLLLAAVLFQTIYSLLQLNKMRRKVAFMAAIADLCFGIYLLGLTGGLSSPFLIYSFTGLWMLKLCLITSKSFWTVVGRSMVGCLFKQARTNCLFYTRTRDIAKITHINLL